METISRHFIAVGNRQMQVRRAGRGPALVLLHQSPLSSADLVPMMAELAPDFTCLAFDTAGYGHSDPLPQANPAIADYAEAVLAALDAAGVGRFLLYGNHTGGCIAAELARRHPERVAACALDGYVIFTPEEQRDLLAHYTPSLAPRWDGTHLVWLWARIRHEYAWFPWHRPGDGMRVDVDLPDARALHERMIDWLRAGENYFVAYKAAFRFDGAAVIRAVRVPTLLATMQPDPLVVHLDRLPPLGPHMEVARTGWERQEIIDRIRAFLRRHGAGVAAPPPVATRPTGSTPWRDFLPVEGEALHAWRGGATAGEPVLFLHGAGESNAAWTGLIETVARRHPVLAPDLPGHGESAPSLTTLTAAAGAVDAALTAAGIGRCAVVGQGFGAALAQELARHRPVGRIVALDAAAPAAEDIAQAGEIAPLWHGGHILEAWHRCRDAGLYRPWYRRARDALHDDAEALRPETVHRRVVDLFKSGAAAPRALALHAAAGTPSGPAVTPLSTTIPGWREMVAELLR
jgi:haloalkane dehalogenase